MGSRRGPEDRSKAGGEAGHGWAGWTGSGRGDACRGLRYDRSVAALRSIAGKLRQLIASLIGGRAAGTVPTLPEAGGTASVAAAARAAEVDGKGLAGKVVPMRERDLAVIASARQSGRWQGLVDVANLLASDDRFVLDAAAEAISELLPKITPAELATLERLLRVRRWATPWGNLFARGVTKMEWPIGVWALLTMNPSGRVRQAAVQKVAETASPAAALPFLLVRLNDWVDPVRRIAAEAAREILAHRDAAMWVPVLCLVEQNRHRSRADHRWLIDAVTEMLQQPDARDVLREAVRSRDKVVARWAFAAAMGLAEGDRAVFIAYAMTHRDPIARQRAAKAVRAWKECPDRDRLVAAMAADWFMPIRREALYEALTFEREAKRAHLRAALLDRRASMRHAARFYLREDATANGEAFDGRAFYLDALRHARPDELAAAIDGLGECGTRDDAELLAPLVTDRPRRVAEAAVRAVRQLDGARRLEWFVERLSDARAAVAHEACEALMAHAFAVPRQQLRALLAGAPEDHTRRMALRVLLCRHPYDAVVEAILAARSSSPATAERTLQYLQWDIRGVRVYYAPSEAQKAAARAALASLRQPLDEESERMVRRFMHLDEA